MPPRVVRRRASHLGWVALVALLLTACSGDDRLSLAVEGGDAEPVVLALADLEDPAWWRPGGPDAKLLSTAAEVIADDLDAVFAVAAGDGPPAGWERGDRSALGQALRRLLAEPESHPPLARAMAMWLDPRLPAALGQVGPEGPIDVEDARRVNGWARVVDAALDAQDLEVARHWQQTVTLASLEVAEEQARTQAADLDQPWALALAYAQRWHAERDLDTSLWGPGAWSDVLHREILPSRWLDTAPEEVAAAAGTDLPAWPGSAEVVEAWRQGQDVADRPEAREVYETLDEWLAAQRRDATPLVGALLDVSRPVDPRGLWQAPPTAGDAD